MSAWVYNPEGKEGTLLKNIITLYSLRINFEMSQVTMFGNLSFNFKKKSSLKKGTHEQHCHYCQESAIRHILPSQCGQYYIVC